MYSHNKKGVILNMRTDITVEKIINGVNRLDNMIVVGKIWIEDGI